jgi:hypothetical protein
METPRENIQDLFSMFHDFDIADLKYENSTLALLLKTPWGELWDEDETYNIKLELSGCNHLHCDYQEKVHSGPFKSYEDINFDKIEYSTKNIETILSLNLSIQSYEFKEPDQYTFYCRGSDKIDEGQVKFTALHYRLSDGNNNDLSLDKMKELAGMWWNSIQKMWDDQKNEN